MSVLLSLAALRQTPQVGPQRFLRYHPGCWLQYYDDTPRRDPRKALSARTFEPDVARRKQSDRCAVCYSLQAFGRSRTTAGLVSFRNLGIDVDLVAAPERRSLSAEEIDRRKQRWLTEVLLPFPLSPHWLTETRHGFHAVFRVQPLSEEARIREAQAVNRRLVRALGGDPNAALLTQTLRVPGTLQFKGPAPFLCLLLLDNAATIPLYDVRDVRAVLDAWEAFRPAEQDGAVTNQPGVALRLRWRGGLAGIPEGGRNAAAAALAGAILRRLPEELWSVAGWGGLKVWNAANSPPLSEQELRAVFESIARRERTRRRGGRPASPRRDAQP